MLDNIEDIELKAQALSQVEQHARVHGGFVNSYSKEKLAAAGFSKSEIEDISQALRNREGFGGLKGGAPEWWTKLMEWIGGGDSDRGQRRALMVSGAILTVGVVFTTVHYLDKKEGGAALRRAIDHLSRAENEIVTARRIAGNKKALLEYYQTAKNKTVDALEKLETFGPSPQFTQALNATVTTIGAFNTVAETVKLIK